MSDIPLGRVPDEAVFGPEYDPHGEPGAGWVC